MIHLVGCSHHNTPVELREQLAFSPQKAEQALARFRQEFPQVEAVVLSTCNRVEFYTAAESPEELLSHRQMGEFLARFHQLDADQVLEQLFRRSGQEAVMHLFMVAAGLDSMVVGEPQIRSQVKQAYDLACRCETAGPVTHAVFQAALKAARRVSNETSIHRKRVSVPSVAVAEFAKQIFERFDDKQVLVIGAGEMAEETLRYATDEGAKHITVVNRSLDRAEQLARRWQGRARPWDQLLDALTEADMVISTTGATEPIVRLEDFRRIEPQRYQRPLLVLDLAIPRDFEPAIGDCLGVYLFSVDDLQEVCRQNLRERQQELPAAVEILKEETAAFMAELNRRATGPVIHRLRQNWQQIKDDELRRLFNKLPDLDPRSRREIEYAFHRLLNKLLHPPLESLRDHAQEGVPHGLLEALRKLFQLPD